MFLVDGGWSDWQNVTNCSTTCGEGVITQQRTCTQPSPRCGGSECSGKSIVNTSCNDKCCPSKYVATYVCTYIKITMYCKMFSSSML